MKIILYLCNSSIESNVFCFFPPSVNLLIKVFLGYWSCQSFLGKFNLLKYYFALIVEWA